MSEHGDDLRHEVRLLRTEVDRLAADGRDTRRLAADTDEQVADLQAAFAAQTTVLNALRETQVEQHQTIQRLSAAVGGLTLQVHGIDTKVEALDTKVEALDTKVEALDTRVATLDTKVEALDTKVGALAEGQTEHTRILTEHGRLLTEILSRLPER